MGAPPQNIDQSLMSHVALAEYERLRNEIDNRTTISETIILGHITALGTGLSLFNTAPDILLALSYVSSLLWLSWLAHTHQIYKLSSYIATELAPRFISPEESPPLYWETYSKLVDLLGPEAYAKLSTERCNEASRKLPERQRGTAFTRALASVLRTKPQIATRISWFVAFLFGAPPIALLLVYVSLPSVCLTTSRVLLMIGAVIILLYTFFRYLGLIKIQEAIDAAVIAKGCGPPPA